MASQRELDAARQRVEQAWDAFFEYFHRPPSEYDIAGQERLSKEWLERAAEYDALRSPTKSQ